MNYLTFDKQSGRILSTGARAQDRLVEELPRAEGVFQASHYVRWSSVDANGRPVNPFIEPRTLLVATLTPGVPGGAKARVVIPTDRPSLRVQVDGVEAEYAAETWQGETAVVLERSSPIAKSWRVSVDEVERYLPELRMEVTDAP